MKDRRGRETDGGRNGEDRKREIQRETEAEGERDKRKKKLIGGDQKKKV